jgi:hypothetical protein
VQGDLRAMIRSYQVNTGRYPAELSIGQQVAEYLAEELWAEQQAFRFTGPQFTRKEALDAILAGEMCFMNIPISVETVFPSPAQAEAIEGYRQVGPC